MLVSLQAVLVLLLTAVCAFTDFRQGKIYNKVTYPAAAAGLVLSLASPPPTFAWSLAGLVGALAAYGLLSRVGGMGIGDVKLMAALGALKGLPFIFFASFYIFLAASVAGVAVLAWNGRLLPALKWVGGTLASAVVPGYSPPKLEGGMTTMPFGPSIFIGTAFCLLLEYSNGAPFTF